MIKSSPVWICAILLTCSGCFQRQPVATTQAGEMRIISLAPSITEIICALGAEKTLVGRTSACDYPPEIVKDVPVVGGFGAPSLELLLKTRPTLILDIALEDKNIGDQIKTLGLRRERVKCSRVDDIPQAILTVGKYLHREKAAATLAEQISREIASLRSAAQQKRDSSYPFPTVYVEIWSDPLMTVGGQSFISDLIQLAGGRNIGDELKDKDYFHASAEWVVARNPDIILCLYMTRATSLHDLVSSRVGWASIKAVKNNRIYGGLDDSLILRPGPRVLEGITVLHQCIEDKSGSNP